MYAGIQRRVHQRGYSQVSRCQPQDYTQEDVFREDFAVAVDGVSKAESSCRWGSRLSRLGCYPPPVDPNSHRAAGASTSRPVITGVVWLDFSGARHAGQPDPESGTAIKVKLSRTVRLW